MGESPTRVDVQERSLKLHAVTATRLRMMTWMVPDMGWIQRFYYLAMLVPSFVMMGSSVSRSPCPCEIFMGIYLHPSNFYTSRWIVTYYSVRYATACSKFVLSIIDLCINLSTLARDQIPGSWDKVISKQSC